MNRWKTENLAQALKPASSDQEMDLDNPVTPNPTGQTFSASRPSLAHRESQVQGVRSSLYTRSPICVRSPILSPLPSNTALLRDLARLATVFDEEIDQKQPSASTRALEDRSITNPPDRVASNMMESSSHGEPTQPTAGTAGIKRKSNANNPPVDSNPKHLRRTAPNDNSGERRNSDMNCKITDAS
ncbi:hypothetical protein PCANC_08120 [Puccinia coronata f. sp. avenae]|uniref:Uncharacterized protein n=1 Tax=Puccinia coronata f. sp. avenae TaxID=200324 RepID=A0A2N5RVS5_9BASI|nr:hypothetical protein PCANC_25490 [Puccinia coronata f. sp. avenae]PLW44560.1 hypothetical protein PCANC_08120 [Puccinia coronata f. sp. avenae]